MTDSAYPPVTYAKFSQVSDMSLATATKGNDHA